MDLRNGGGLIATFYGHAQQVAVTVFNSGQHITVHATCASSSVQRDVGTQVVEAPMKQTDSMEEFENIFPAQESTSADFSSRDDEGFDEPSKESCARSPNEQEDWQNEDVTSFCRSESAPTSTTVVPVTRKLLKRRPKSSDLPRTRKRCDLIKACHGDANQDLDDEEHSKEFSEKEFNRTYECYNTELYYLNDISRMLKDTFGIPRCKCKHASCPTVKYRLEAHKRHCKPDPETCQRSYRSTQSSPETLDECCPVMDQALRYSGQKYCDYSQSNRSDQTCVASFQGECGISSCCPSSETRSRCGTGTGCECEPELCSTFKCRLEAHKRHCKPDSETCQRSYRSTQSSPETMDESCPAMDQTLRYSGQKSCDYSQSNRSDQTCVASFQGECGISSCCPSSETRSKCGTGCECEPELCPTVKCRLEAHKRHCKPDPETSQRSYRSTQSSPETMDECCPVMDQTLRYSGQKCFDYSQSNRSDQTCVASFQGECGISSCCPSSETRSRCGTGTDCVNGPNIQSRGGQDLDMRNEGNCRKDCGMRTETQPKKYQDFDIRNETNFRQDCGNGPNIQSRRGQVFDKRNEGNCRQDCGNGPNVQSRRGQDFDMRNEGNCRQDFGMRTETLPRRQDFDSENLNRSRPASGTGEKPRSGRLRWSFADNQYDNQSQPEEKRPMEDRTRYFSDQKTLPRVRNEDVDGSRTKDSKPSQRFSESTKNTGETASRLYPKPTRTTDFHPARSYVEETPGFPTISKGTRFDDSDITDPRQTRSSGRDYEINTTLDKPRNIRDCGRNSFAKSKNWTKQGTDDQNDVSGRNRYSRNDNGNNARGGEDDRYRRKSPIRDLSGYETKLRSHIMNWLDGVPVLPNQRAASKQFRSFLAHSLAQKIKRLANQVSELNYEKLVITEIDDCLNSLPIWVPNAKKDQYMLKNKVIENLLIKMRQLNRELAQRSFQKKGISGNIEKSLDGSEMTENHPTTQRTTCINRMTWCTKRNQMKNEIYNWIDNTEIKIISEIDVDLVVEVLSSRLKPFLGTNIKRSRSTLIRRIFYILNELPIDICRSNEKAFYLRRLAGDLADRLSHDGCIPNIFSADEKYYKLLCNKGNEEKITNRPNLESNGNQEDDNISSKSIESFEKESKFVLDDSFHDGGDKRGIEEIVKPILANSQSMSIDDYNEDYELRNTKLSGTLMVYQNTPNTCGCKASTPRGSRENKVDNKVLDNINLDISEIRPDEGLVPLRLKQKQSPEEKSYTQAVEKEINKWMETLPIKFQTKEDKKFKSVMIKDLAGGVADRQKYLQLHPETTDEEEVEQMSFQIHRWLFKLVDDDEHDRFDSAVMYLMEILKKIPVPILVMPYQGNRQELKIIAGGQPAAVDKIEDEISIWMNEQPSTIYTTADKKVRNGLINELAVKLMEQIKDSHDTNSDKRMEKDIKLWLGKIVKPNELKGIQNLTRSLKDRMQRLPESIYAAPTINEVNFITDQVISGAMDWLKDRPWYRKSAPKVKNVLEKQVAKIAHDVMHSFTEIETVQDMEEANQKILLEIKLKFDKLPTEDDAKLADKYNSQDIFSMANQFIVHIRELQVVQMNLQRMNSPDITLDVDAWIQKLPLLVQNQDNVKTFNTLKLLLIYNLTKLKEHESQNPADLQESLMKNEIKKFLKKCPMDQEIKDNDAILNIHAEILVGMLSNPENPCRRQILPNNQAVDLTGRNFQEFPSHETSRVNQTLVECVNAYVEQYEVGDHLTKEAITERLILEFQKHQPLTRQNVYNNLSKDMTVKEFHDELLISKEISEWLKSMPVDPNFNMSKNMRRAELVNELSDKLYALHSSGIYTPGAEEEVLQIIIIWMKQLPVLPGHESNIPYMIKSLWDRLSAALNASDACSDIVDSCPRTCLKTQSIGEETLNDYVEEYLEAIHNPQDFIDEMAREAFALKLTQAFATYIPKAASAQEVYQKIMEVPIPGDTSIWRFSTELRLITDINEWLKNLHTVEIRDENQLHERARHIAALAQYLCNIEEQLRQNPNYRYMNDLNTYMTDWLNKIMITGYKHNYPLIIKQLLNRVDNMEHEYEERHGGGPMVIGPSQIDIHQIPQSPLEASFHQPRMQQPSCCQPKKVTDQCNDKLIAWLQSIPFKAKDQQEIEDLRAQHQFQVLVQVGTLNMDDIILKQPHMYKARLSEVLDYIVSSMPIDPAKVPQMEALKGKLMEELIQLRPLIVQERDNSLYRSNLQEVVERVLKTSLTGPAMTAEQKTKFEKFKEELIDDFILYNYHKDSETGREVYKERIMDVALNFISDPNKNNSLEDAQLQKNKLLFELEIVQIPGDDSVCREVEEIRMKQEITKWLSEVPLPEIDSLESYQREKIKGVLANRLNEMEKDGHTSETEQRMRNEISKCLTKMGLDSKVNISEMVERLMSRLRATEAARRYHEPVNISLAPKRRAVPVDRDISRSWNIDSAVREQQDLYGTPRFDNRALPAMQTDVSGYDAFSGGVQFRSSLTPAPIITTHQGNLIEPAANRYVPRGANIGDISYPQAATRVKSQRRKSDFANSQIQPDFQWPTRAPQPTENWLDGQNTPQHSQGPPIYSTPLSNTIPNRPVHEFVPRPKRRAKKCYDDKGQERKYCSCGSTGGDLVCYDYFPMCPPDQMEANESSNRRTFCYMPCPRLYRH